MAVVKNLMVRAGADFSAITKQSNKAKAAMSGMQTSVTKACSRMSSAVSGVKKVLGALGAALSVTAVVSYAKSAKEAYDTQIEAGAKLAQVMRNTIGASNEEIKAIKELTAAQQALGVVGDEVQLAGAQELATYVTMTSTLETLIPAMNDMVAQQYGLSASAENAASIATMMGKVLSGQTSALSRYGYTFTKAQEEILKYGTEAQRAATLAEVVEQSVGGMNAALAATPSGRLKQVSNTLGDIKENFGKAVASLLTTFLPALNLICSVLASVATLANKAAQAIANVFGAGKSSAATTVAYTAATAAYADAAASGMEDVADATKAAGKASKNLGTYSFDTLQQMSGASSSSDGSGGAGAAEGNGAGGAGGTITESTAGAEEAGESIGWLEAVLSRLKGTVASLNFEPLAAAFGRLKAAAEPLGQTLITGLGWVYDNILDPLAHWTVEDALPAFLDMLAQSAEACNPALERLGNALAPLAISAFEGLKWAYDNVLIPMDTWIGTEAVPAFLDLLAGSAAACGPALEQLGDALAPLVITAFEGLQWAYDNVFIPLGTWTGTELLPAFLGVLAEAANVLSAGLDALKPAGKWLWNNFLQPVASWTGGLVVDVLNGLAEALGKVGNWITSHQTAVENIGIAVGVFAGVWTALNAAVGIWNGLGVIATAVTGAFGAAVAILTSPVTLVIAAIAALVAGVVLLIKNWDTVCEVASNVWASIKEVWGAACTWFDTKVITPIANAFKGFANGIIGFFEGLVNGGINGINTIVKALNKISFDIPDWIPAIGGKKFGFALPTVSTISLPRLAEGAVLPGNDPYLAIVNEQRHGTNVETPLTTMIEAFLTALNTAGLTGGGDIQVNVKAVFEGQLAALARLLRPYFEADAKRVGNKASTSKVVV